MPEQQNTTRPDNKVFWSLWIMFAIGLGIYFRVWDVVNEATGGMFYRTKAEIEKSQFEAEYAAALFDARMRTKYLMENKD